MKVEFENTRSKYLKGKITRVTTLQSKHWLTYKMLSRNNWEERGPADFPQDLGCLPASKRSWKLRWERWAKLPCFSILLGSRVTHDYIPRKSLFQWKGVQWKQMPKSKKVYPAARPRCTALQCVQEHVKFPGYPKGEGETRKSASSLTPLRL